MLALAVTIAAMVGAVWALRATREVYHPWYARPDRLFMMIAAVGGAAAWMMARAGRWIPSRARGLRHPAVAWTYTLPLWIVLAMATTWLAPAAAYLGRAAANTGRRAAARAGAQRAAVSAGLWSSSRRPPRSGRATSSSCFAYGRGARSAAVHHPAVWRIPPDRGGQG